MARTPSKTRDKTNPPPPDDDDDDRADIAEVMAAIEAASNDSDTANTWLVSVTRVQGGRGTAEARLFHCAPADIPGIEDRLRAEWGEGHYRVRVRYRAAQFKQFDLPIEFSPIEKRQWAEKMAEWRREPSTAPAPAIDTAGISAQERFYLALTERLAAAPAPAVDPFEMFDRVLELVDKRMGGVTTPPPVDPVAQIEQTLSIVEKLKGVTGGDSGGGDGGMWGAIGSFVNSDVGKALALGLMQSFAPQLAGGQQQQAARVAAPIPQPAPASIAPNQLPPQLNQAITYLVDQAQRGADPQLAAEWVVQNLPVGLLQLLDAQGDIVAYLEQNFPAVAVHRAWFAALVDNLWEGEEAPSPPPSREGEHVGQGANDPAKPEDRHPAGAEGDARNPQADAPTRAAG